MTPLHNVEAYLTSTRAGQQTGGVYFDRGEVIHLHLGAPRPLPMILQLVSVKGEVSLETMLRVTQTQSPNTYSAMNGLGLEASYQIPTERLKFGA